MSKAFRGVKKTKQGPNLERFQQRGPLDAEQEKRRLRSIAQRLQGSGRSLADATPKATP